MKKRGELGDRRRLKDLERRKGGGLWDWMIVLILAPFFLVCLWVIVSAALVVGPGPTNLGPWPGGGVGP